MVTAVTSQLDRRVLVLNRYYAGIRVVSVRRALSMLYRQLAEVVHVEDNNFEGHDFNSWLEVSEYRAKYLRDRHEWIRGVRFELAVPHIIRLLWYDRLPKQVVKLNRRNIYARDHSLCQYCGRKFSTSDLSLDHVIPRVQGGKTTWENVVCSCLKCNVRKGGRSPAQAHMKLITPPVKPKRPPTITHKLPTDRYASWKQFLNEAYWSVEFKE